MVRLHSSIADLLDQFVLVRVVSMRGIDLNRFDFDFDQEWAALFLRADGYVYGRFHAPCTDVAEQYLTLPAFRHALTGALQRHRQPARAAAVPARPARTVEEYPAVARLRPSACIHCHQVHEYRREADQALGRWKKEDVWIYPGPENIGLTLEIVKSNVVRSVAQGSSAGRVGLQPGDVLRSVHDLPVNTIADVQYALQQAPARGSLAVTWERAGQTLSARLDLVAGWRRSDVSWRASLKRYGPPAGVDGVDLTADEKNQLGLAPGQLAFRQDAFPSAAARQAGIQPGDIILGIQEGQLAPTARQFRTHIQLHFEAGTTITFQVLRGGQRLDVPFTLPRPPPF